MRKFLSGVVLSATIIAGNAPLVLANPTNLNAGNGVTVNSVAPKSSLIEFGGRTLTDAEAAKVEGEIVWTPILVGAGTSLALTTYNCYTFPGARCGWKQYGSAVIVGAAAPAAKGFLAVKVAKQARLTWFMRR